MNTRLTSGILLLQIVGSLSAVAQAQSRPPIAEVPITFKRNQVRIPVSVNGSPPFMLILDTGMPGPGILLCDSDRVAALGLEFPAADSIHGGGAGAAVTTRVAEGAHIKLGELTRDSVTVSVMPAGTLQGDAEGIIGGELFDNYAVRVDTDSRLLTLIEPSTFEPDVGTRSVPLRIREGMAFVDARVVVDRGAPVTVDIAVDLGAGHALWLNEGESGRLTPPANAIVTTLGRGVQGDIRGAFARVKQLEIGEFTFERVIALFPAKEFHNPGGVDFKDGFVGAEVLRRFVVTFDYPSKRMVLFPGRNFKEPFEFDMSGMMLAMRGSEGRRVDEVLPGSPAETAGVRAGDTLVAVDGKTLAEMGPDELRKALQRDGAEVLVTLDRAGTRIEKTLRLRRLL